MRRAKTTSEYRPMNMPIIRAHLLVLVFLATASSFAQPAEESILEDQLLANAREVLQAGRKEIIADELRLTDTEAAAFWPVYDAYHADVMAVRDEQADTIGRYLKTYRAGGVTDAYAEELLGDGLSIKNELLKVQKRYLKKFRKALPIRKVVRFYQLESKMDAEIDAQLAIVIPLMDPV